MASPWASTSRPPDRSAPACRPARSPRCSGRSRDSRTCSTRRHASRCPDRAVGHRCGLIARNGLPGLVRSNCRAFDVRLTFALHIRSVPAGLSVDGQAFGARKSGRHISGVAVVLYGIVQIECGLLRNRGVTGMLDGRRCQAVDCRNFGLRMNICQGGKEHILFCLQAGS